MDTHACIHVCPWVRHASPPRQSPTRRVSSRAPVVTSRDRRRSSRAPASSTPCSSPGPRATAPPPSALPFDPEAATVCVEAATVSVLVWDVYVYVYVYVYVCICAYAQVILPLDLAGADATRELLACARRLSLDPMVTHK